MNAIQLYLPFEVQSYLPGDTKLMLCSDPGGGQCHHCQAPTSNTFPPCRHHLTRRKHADGVVQTPQETICLVSGQGTCVSFVWGGIR